MERKEEPLITRLIQTINTWIRYESRTSKYEVTTGLTNWWYSPSTGAILPADDPMEASRRAGGKLLGVDDWIFLAQTVDAELTIGGQPTYFEMPEDFWLT